MTITAFQRDQVGVLLHWAFLEIQHRIGKQQYKAASDLAYACHNLPVLAASVDHFELTSIRRWFMQFHESHGSFHFNYISMLNAIEAGSAITFEIATAPLGGSENSQLS